MAPPDERAWGFVMRVGGILLRITTIVWIHDLAIVRPEQEDRIGPTSRPES